MAKKQEKKKPAPKVKKFTTAQRLDALEHNLCSIDGLAADNFRELKEQRDNVDTLSSDVHKMQVWVEDHKSTSMFHTVVLIVLAVMCVCTLIVAL